MKVNEKGFTLKFFLAFVITNILVYAFYHVAYLMGYNWTLYVHMYISQIWEFIFVPITSVLMLVVWKDSGILGAFKIAVLSSVAHIFHSIPYQYMQNMRSDLPNSFDSIIISLIYTVCEMLLTIIILYVICGIVFLVFRARGGAKSYVSTSLKEAASFDFSIPASLICLIPCLVQFAIKLVPTIVDTVDFLVGFGGGYTLGEMLLILFDYVVCIALLPLCYLVICKLKKKFVDSEGNE